MLAKKIFVSGRVQGVFFRESTRQIASELNLTGGVRNLADGRVEVQVSGQEESVQSLIKWLEIGPKLSIVSTIEVLVFEVVDPAVDLLLQQKNGQFTIWPTN